MDRYTELLNNIALAALCDNNPNKMSAYIKAFDDVEQIFTSHDSDSRWRGFRGGKVSRKKALVLAERTIDVCEESAIDILLLDDDDYPQRLKNIPDPPRVLYVKGKMPQINSLLGISIVGTRYPTDETRDVTRKLARDLAQKGVVIISGMAIGIDGAAHQGALDAGGTTIAVLAGGVDCIYPKIHTEMYGQIIEHGAVVSEWPPGTVGRPSYYEGRNRIIAGLAFGVLFAEGKIKRSGTSITLRHATEFGRDVFAVPGSPAAKYSELPNRILRDGAILTCTAEDILDEYLDYEELLNNGKKLLSTPLMRTAAAVRDKLRKEIGKDDVTDAAKPRINLELFSEPERMILEYLCKHKEAVHIDSIIGHCGIDAARIGGMMTMLEMKGVVVQLPGSRYSIK